VEPRLASENSPDYVGPCSQLANDRVGVKTRSSEQEEPMIQPSAADDFAMIRARMKELRWCLQT
jgi:hypothetical protein